MRDIIFHAKRKDNNEWVEGSYNLRPDGQFILCMLKESGINNSTSDEHYYLWLKPIIPDTLGQYTGRVDKNNKKIFEGDVLRELIYPFRYAEVAWLDYASAFGLLIPNNPNPGVEGLYMAGFDPQNWEIVGNIYDNPELRCHDGLSDYVIELKLNKSKL